MTPLDTTSSTARARSSRWIWLRPLLLGLGAATLWGAWAFHANLSSGMTAALRAALTQAGSSFAMNGGMAMILEWLFRLGRTPVQGFWLSWLGGAVIAAGGTTAAHALAGTPHLLLTVAPSLALGTAFGFAYAWGLRAGTRRPRRDRHRACFDEST